MNIIHLLHHAAFKKEKALLDADELMVGNVPGTDGANAQDVENEGSAGEALISAFGRNFVDRTGGALPRGSRLRSNANVGGRTDAQFVESDLGNNYKVRSVNYVDQILPFDVVIVAANEYGNAAQMRLFGCEILNEGSGFSIDDMVVENQMTYVCRTILPWRGTGRARLQEHLATKAVRGAENNSSSTSDGGDIPVY